MRPGRGEAQAAFSVDHIVPQSLDQSSLLRCEYSNLLYAWCRCNSARQDELVIDPTQEGLGEHLLVNPDGTMTYRSLAGSLLIEILHLNDPLAIRERQRILRILHRRARYPNDAEVLNDFREAFGFPEDLPDLRRGRRLPPGGNALSENTEFCCYARRERGELPDICSFGECPNSRSYWIHCVITIRGFRLRHPRTTLH